MKSKPLSVANPRTAGQVAQRTKFTEAVSFAVALLVSVIKPLWDRFAQRESGYNAFVRTNIPAFDSSGVVDPSSIVISKGSLTPISTASASFDESGQSVSVAWSDNSGSGSALGTDELYAALYDSDTNQITGYSAIGIRSAEIATFAPSEDLTLGTVMYLYLAFRRSDGTLVSDTVRVSGAVVA
jgi:hypothetical protein